MQERPGLRRSAWAWWSVAVEDRRGRGEFVQGRIRGRRGPFTLERAALVRHHAAVPGRDITTDPVPVSTEAKRSPAMLSSADVPASMSMFR
ncbi:hypothetical protein [Gordonia paraffinivorans]|uniref:hypothetical protein n=1 Tax=Gordonia paraffinivorans TaxID=175628 RepID=UPI0011B21402|nr:hypothetical protein [Gordonia paraffinivorans]